MTVRLDLFAWDVLYWRLATALAGHPRCAWRHSERAKLNHVLHLRDLSEKNEGIHVLGHAMAASSATGRFRHHLSALVSPLDAPAGWASAMSDMVWCAERAGSLELAFFLGVLGALI